MDNESNEQLYNPGAIYLLASDYAELPHDEALDKLKTDYTTHQWEDPEKAAKNFAEATDIIHKTNGVTPETDFQESFAETVSAITNERIPEEKRLDIIDQKGAELKAALYADPKDVDGLSTAAERERMIDAITLTLKRTVISKDVGRWSDMLSRFMDSAAAPIAGAIDIAYDSDNREKLQERTFLSTNPEYDEDLVSTVSSVLGSIGGTAASGILAGPWGATAYLGAQIATEAKSVYDTTYDETGSIELAEAAVVESVPAHLVAAFGDRVMGGTIAKIVKGQGGAATVGKGVLGGLAAEGLGETFEEYWVGKTLTKYTDNPAYTPTEKELLNVFMASSLVGGTIGAAGGLRSQQIVKAQELSKAIKEGAPVEINGEKIEDPQGFMSKLAQKVGYDQFLRTRAKKEGKTVEEVYDEEGISRGAEIFNEVADEMVNNLGVTDTVVPYDQLSEDQVGSIGSALAEYTEEIGGTMPDSAEYGIDEDLPPLEFLVGQKDYSLIRELIEESVNFKITDETIENYYKSNPLIQKQAQKKYDTWMKDNQRLTGQPYKSESEQLLEQLDQTEFLYEDQVINRAEQVELQKLQNTKNKYKWLPSNKEERLEQLLEKQRTTDIINSKLGIESAKPAEKKKKIARWLSLVEDKKAKTKTEGVADEMAAPGETKKEDTQALPPDFGHAWPLGESAAPMTFGVQIANELGVKLTAKILGKGVLGSHLKESTDAPAVVTFIREMFRNPKAFLQTFWHEMFHAIDMEAAIADGIVTDPITAQSLEPHRENPVYNKMKRIYDNFIELGLSQEKEAFTAAVRDLDMAWNPYDVNDNPAHTQYRQRGTEQYANAMAAIMTNPERVRDNYPTVWRVFSESVSAHPKLQQLVNLVDSNKDDPSVLSGAYSDISAKGRKKEAEIVGKAAEQRVAQRKKDFLSIPNNVGKSLYRSLFTTFSHVDKVLNHLVKEGGMSKEHASKLYQKVIRPQNLRDDINRLFDAPMEKTIKKLVNTVSDAPDVAMAKLADFMNLRHILEDTNETLDGIKTHPEEYKEAFEFIADKLELPEWKDKIANLEGEDLIVEMSKLLIEIDDVTRLKVQKEARKEEQEYADRLLEDDTFRVRRLMANYGVDYYGAQALYNTKKREAGFDPLTGEKGEFEHYETALKEMHSLGHLVIKEMTKAGLLTAKNKDKLTRNVEHYATQNVIKYFEQDPRINAGIRKAIGALDMTGNPITSYISKMEALYARAVYQQSQNTIVNIAKQNEETVTEIVPKKITTKKGGIPKVHYENVFDKRVALEKRNPEKSYFISTQGGIAKLFEIDNPDYKKVFSESYLLESTVGNSLVQLSDAVNKTLLAHWTKTLGNLGFVWASQRYDTIREATRADSKELNLTHLFGWFRHLDPKLYRMKQEAKARAEKIIDTGQIDERTDYFMKHGFRPTGISREYGGRTEIDTVQHLVYELSGDYIKGSEDLWIPDWVNKNALKFFHKLPGMKRIQRRGEIDELATKIMGLEIETSMRGKGPWEASRMANELYGTPDPGIGGSEMPALNHLFMFSRAGANGARALVTMAKDDPKSFAFQMTYRKLLPWMYTSGAIMGPIIGAIAGDDAEEVYRKYLSKIASYHRDGKNIIPTGFIDQKGNFRFFTDVKASEILPSWKAAAIAIPHERGLVTMGQAMSPMLNALEDLLDTGTISGKRIAEDAAAAFKQVAGGGMSPGLQLGVHMATTGGLMYGNPKDYFRKRGILDKDVAEAGNLYEKFVDYAMWTFFQSYPGMLAGFQNKKTRTTEPTSIFDTITKLPQLGTALKRFALVTNFGDVEKSMEGAKLMNEMDSSIKLTYGDYTKDAVREASSYAGMIRGYSRNGKQWRKEIKDRAQIRKIETFQKWYYGDRVKAMQEMRDAQEAGDIKKRNRIRDKLELTAKRLINKY